MAKEIPSVGDLRCESEASNGETGAATADYLKDKTTERRTFKSKHTINVAEYIKACLPANTKLIQSVFRLIATERLNVY
jgi:hypothetical protein